MDRRALGLVALNLVIGLYLFPSPMRSFAAGLFKARDPGIRLGAPSAGPPIEGLSLTQLSFFQAGKEDFESEEGVAEGLGPRMNLDSCVGCHSYPTGGGSSPFVNPQIAFDTKYGASNLIPPFISLNRPVREARLIKYPDGSLDGNVQALFYDYRADGCTRVRSAPAGFHGGTCQK